MKERLETSVRVSGSGDSRQKAIADALNAVQRTILQGTTHIILRIEPKDIAVVSATSKITTEKFLFFFLPRQRKHYSVVLDVTASVTLLDVEAIHFKQTLSANPDIPKTGIPEESKTTEKHNAGKA
ncbi:cytoplasmic protein [Xenorhabdus vietnamensis]|uniref:Cytoplasmic protein n=1 Tax=Xenorhabdus vietnamensis TaxID=351656 RepID=A0A1Y2SDA8_9GAMM|nr:cytoplasmic protein [Xenorhabdus vietnamensis]